MQVDWQDVTLLQRLIWTFNAPLCNKKQNPGADQGFLERGFGSYVKRCVEGFAWLISHFS